MTKNLKLGDRLAIIKNGVAKGQTPQQAIAQYKINEDGGYNAWKNQFRQTTGVNPDQDDTYNYEQFFKENPDAARQLLQGKVSPEILKMYKTPQAIQREKQAQRQGRGSFNDLMDYSKYEKLINDYMNKSVSPQLLASGGPINSVNIYAEGTNNINNKDELNPKDVKSTQTNFHKDKVHHWTGTAPAEIVISREDLNQKRFKTLTIEPSQMFHLPEAFQRLPDDVMFVEIPKAYLDEHYPGRAKIDNSTTYYIYRSELDNLQDGDPIPLHSVGINDAVKEAYIYTYESPEVFDSYQPNQYIDENPDAEYTSVLPNVTVGRNGAITKEDDAKILAKSAEPTVLNPLKPQIEKVTPVLQQELPQGIQGSPITTPNDTNGSSLINIQGSLNGTPTGLGKPQSEQEEPFYIDMPQQDIDWSAFFDATPYPITGIDWPETELEYLNPPGYVDIPNWNVDQISDNEGGMDFKDFIMNLAGYRDNTLRDVLMAKLFEPKDYFADPYAGQRYTNTQQTNDPYNNDPYTKIQRESNGIPLYANGGRVNLFYPGGGIDDGGWNLDLNKLNKSTYNISNRTNRRNSNTNSNTNNNVEPIQSISDEEAQRWMDQNDWFNFMKNSGYVSNQMMPVYANNQNDLYSFPQLDFSQLKFTDNWFEPQRQFNEQLTDELGKQLEAREQQPSQGPLMDYVNQSMEQLKEQERLKNERIDKAAEEARNNYIQWLQNRPLDIEDLLQPTFITIPDLDYYRYMVAGVGNLDELREKYPEKFTLKEPQIYPEQDQLWDADEVDRAKNMQNIVQNNLLTNQGYQDLISSYNPYTQQAEIEQAYNDANKLNEIVNTAQVATAAAANPMNFALSMAAMYAGNKVGDKIADKVVDWTTPYENWNEYANAKWGYDEQDGDYSNPGGLILGAAGMFYGPKGFKQLGNAAENVLQYRTKIPINENYYYRQGRVGEGIVEDAENSGVIRAGVDPLTGKQHFNNPYFNKGKLHYGNDPNYETIVNKGAGNYDWAVMNGADQIMPNGKITVSGYNGKGTVDVDFGFRTPLVNGKSNMASAADFEVYEPINIKMFGRTFNIGYKKRLLGVDRLFGSDPNALINRNIRTSLFNDKIPFNYKLDKETFTPFIKGLVSTLKSERIPMKNFTQRVDELSKTGKNNIGIRVPTDFHAYKPEVGATPEEYITGIGNLFGYYGPEAQALIRANNRLIAWRKYLGLGDLESMPLFSTYGGFHKLQYKPLTNGNYTLTGLTKQDYENLAMTYGEIGLKDKVQTKRFLGFPIHRKNVPGKVDMTGIGYDYVAQNHGHIGGKIQYFDNGSFGIKYVDPFDLHPLQSRHYLPSFIRNIEASQVVRGAKPFTLELDVPLQDAMYVPEGTNSVKTITDFDSAIEGLSNYKTLNFPTFSPYYDFNGFKYNIIRKR